MHNFSILICTHNRLTLLKRTIDFLNKANRPANSKISLFVAANACSDKTVEFLKEYQHNATKGQLPLSWIEENKPGKSNALNSAIPKLKGLAVAMVDDDHRIDSNYFIAIDKALTDYPDIDFFCGKIIPDWDGTEPEWIHDQGKYRIYPLPVPRFELGEQSKPVSREIAVPGGGNLVIKTDLFNKVGSFSTELGPVGHNLSGGEDFHWVVRAYETGAKLQYIPDIIQYHYVESQRLTLRYVIKKSFERTFCVIQQSPAAQNYSGPFFPQFLLKKSGKYLFHLVFSLSNSARRFYLVRLAATIGEINGYIKVKNAKS